LGPPKSILGGNWGRLSYIGLCKPQSCQKQKDNYSTLQTNISLKKKRRF